MTIAHTMNHVYVQMHLALIPVFMAEFSLSLFMVGLMVSIPLICQSLATVPCGMLADKIGDFPQVVLSLILIIIAATMVSVAPNIFIIVLSFSMLALGVAMYHPPGYSITSEVFPARHRSKALGIHGAGGTLGWSLGPFSVGILIALVGWRLLYAVWTAPVLLCALLMLRAKPMLAKSEDKAQPPATEAPPGIKPMFTINFLLLLAAVGMHSMGVHIVSTFISSYLVLVRSLTVPIASLILGLTSIAGVVGAPIGGFLADRLGDKKWLAVSYFGTMLCLLGIAYAQSMWSLVLLSFLYGFINLSGMGPSSSLTARLSPRTRRGLAFGLYFMPTYAVSAVAPIVGALIAESFGIWSTFPLAVGIILVALLVLLLMKSD